MVSPELKPGNGSISATDAFGSSSAHIVTTANEIEFDFDFPIGLTLPRLGDKLQAWLVAHSKGSEFCHPGLHLFAC